MSVRALGCGIVGVGDMQGEDLWTTKVQPRMKEIVVSSCQSVQDMVRLQQCVCMSLFVSALCALLVLCSCVVVPRFVCLVRSPRVYACV